MGKKASGLDVRAIVAIAQMESSMGLLVSQHPLELICLDMEPLIQTLVMRLITIMKKLSLVSPRLPSSK